MGRRWSGPVVGGLIAAGLLAGVAPPVGPAHAIEGLDTTATVTYTVDFAAGVVRGHVDLHFVNSVPDRPTADGLEQTIFTGFELTLPGDATNIAALTANGPAAATVTRGNPFQTVAIPFGTELAYQDTLDVSVTFDLPGFPPRSGRPGRANTAFVAFVARGMGDPGRATVRIVTPASADVAIPDLDAGSIPRPQVVQQGDLTIRTFATLERPHEFALFVSASDNRKLAARRLRAAGQTIVVQAWPDDPRWSRFVSRQVRTGLPALADLIGRPPRERNRLVLRESARPGLQGYSGWYDYISGVIEVGEQLDRRVTLHELAHGWFDDDTSHHRWVTEGLAETYANAVVERSGGRPRTPVRPDARAPGRQPLNAWQSFDFARQDQDVENYGYDASYFVMDSLFDEIGPARMAAVIAAIEDRTPAYGVDGTVDTGPAGWRRLLDLFERVGGSERATRLFRRYVVTPAELDELTTRTEAVARYQGLAEHAGDWPLPAGLGAAMERWEFDTAADLVAAAEVTLAARDRFTAAAAELPAELPAELRTRFAEAATPDELAAIAGEIARLEDALAVVSAAAAAAQTDRSPLASLALGDEDFAADLSEAADAITANDPDRAEAIARDVQSVLAVAEARGGQRATMLADAAGERIGIVAAAAGAGLALALLVALATRVRRRRPGSGDVAPHLDAGGDAAVDRDVEPGVGHGLELDEDALPRAGLRGVDGGLDVAGGDAGEGAGTAGVVERGPGLGDVGDAVLELGEDVGAVVDAQPVARAEVLVDPDAHPDRQT